MAPRPARLSDPGRIGFVGAPLMAPRWMRPILYKCLFCDILPAITQVHIMYIMLNDGFHPQQRNDLRRLSDRFPCYPPHLFR